MSPRKDSDLDEFVRRVEQEQMDRYRRTMSRRLAKRGISLSQYEAAERNLERGIKIRESVTVVHGVSKGARFERLVKMYEELAPSKKRDKKAERRTARHPTFGTLKHDGEAYVGKVATALHAKPVEIRFDVDEWPDEKALDLYKRLDRRQKTLRRELEPRLAQHYKQVRSSWEDPEAYGFEMPPLRRNADIWKQIGAPEVIIEPKSSSSPITISWSPEWAVEHGLYAYLNKGAKVEHVGQFHEERCSDH